MRCNRGKIPGFFRIASCVNTIVLILAAAAACNRSPFLAAQRSGIPSAQPAYAAQMQDLDHRASALDADNRDLHSELARSHQQVQVLQDGLTKKQADLDAAIIERDQLRAELTAIEAL